MCLRKLVPIWFVFFLRIFQKTKRRKGICSRDTTIFNSFILHSSHFFIFQKDFMSKKKSIENSTLLVLLSIFFLHSTKNKKGRAKIVKYEFIISNFPKFFFFVLLKTHIN